MLDGPTSEPTLRELLLERAAQCVHEAGEAASVAEAYGHGYRACFRRLEREAGALLRDLRASKRRAPVSAKHLDAIEYMIHRFGSEMRDEIGLP
jgi:hypothetical protein